MNAAVNAITFPEHPDFWNRVRHAEARFLALDYDGTLAPFAVDPMTAKPLPGTASLLRRLVADRRTSVAIISGRPVQEIMTLLNPPAITVVGCHGHEIWPVDGARIVREPSPVQRQGLSAIETNLRHRGTGLNLEVKLASLAVHTRGMDSAAACAVEQAVLADWGVMAAHHDLECRWFNGGVEFRCAGWNKGEALKELLALHPEHVLPVYIGDDETDEDAFIVLQQRGVGIKVGTPSRSTAARCHLPDCSAVAAFLRTWVATTTPSRRTTAWTQPD